MATRSLSPEQENTSKTPVLPDVKIAGSCACSATKWTSSTLPTGAYLCHCTTCQKISGGSFIAFMDLPLKDVVWSNVQTGTLKMMSLSKSAERGFCGECGSTMSMSYFAEPEFTYLTLASVDVVGKGVLEKLEKKHLYVKELREWDKLPEDGWARWDTMPNQKEYLGTTAGDMKT